MKWHSLVSIHSIFKTLQVTPVTSSAHLFQWRRFPLFSMLIVLLSFSRADAQDNGQQKEYVQVITARSEKIVNVLNIADLDTYNTVVNDLVSQYAFINTTHEQNKEAVDKIKQQPLSKEETEQAIQQQEAKKNELLKQQHEKFIAQLNKNLTGEQIEKVKDGMTYGVFPITYAGYLDMLPSLTAEQKDQIYAWLKEARELAMDAESSDKKHAVFGKYKGRINNYLSKAGYDMNKESKAWQQRTKQRGTK